MYQRYCLTCLGLAALLPALAGCSLPTPTQPDGPGATGFGTASTLLKPTSTPPPFVFPDGCCYYNNTIVRTVVPPAINPRTGRDNFHGFPSDAAAGQKGVVGVAPGDTDYHGGHWKFHAVTFNPGVEPYLLTSEAAVFAAGAEGDVTITRDPSKDFKCPIQP